MRKALHVMGLALLCVSMAACGPREREVDAAARAGILLVGNGSEPKTLDPHLATGVPESDILRALFEGLVSQHPDNDLLAEPGVAESWEHNADFTRWTFTLRADARWSNGQPVTAGDFVYSWKRILSPELGSEYAEMLYVLANAEAFHKGQIADFGQVGVKARDARTLDVVLKGSTPHFPAMLKHSSFYPVNPAAVEAHGGMTDRQSRWSTLKNFVGNGPFKLTAWVTNQIIKAERSDTYWDRANVRLNAIHFFPIDNVPSEETSFMGGRLHVTSTLSPDKISPYLGNYFYRFNVTRKPLDDVRVRMALSLALDRETISREVLKAGEAPAFNLTPPDTAGYTSEAKLSYDPERAKQLLAEAGFPGGQGFPKLEILYNTSETHATIAEVLQRMWKDTLGIEIGLYNQDWKVYLDSMTNLDYDMARGSWIGDIVDPLNFLELFLTDGGNNRTGWSNAEYDALIEKSYATPDKEARYKILQEAEALLLKEVPMLPIYFYTTKYLMAPEVKGFTPNILDYRRWKDMWLEAPAA